MLRGHGVELPPSVPIFGRMVLVRTATEEYRTMAEPKERTPAVPDGCVDPETMATAHRLEALAEVGLAAGYDDDELPKGILCVIVAVGNGEGFAGESAEQVAVLLNAGKHPDGTVRESLFPKEEMLVRAALGRVLAGEEQSPEGHNVGSGADAALLDIRDSDAGKLSDAAFAVAVAVDGEYVAAQAGDAVRVQSLIAAVLCETFGDGGWVRTRDVMEKDVRDAPKGNADGDLGRHFARMRHLRAARRAKAEAAGVLVQDVARMRYDHRYIKGRTLQGPAEVRDAARRDIAREAVAERERAEREG